MIKTIVTATVATIILSSSASACGFFTKAIYGGGCNQTEYEEIKGAKAADKFAKGQEKGFFMEGNLAFADVNGEVVVMTKQDVITAYRSGQKDGIIDLIKKEFSEDKAEEIQKQLDAGVSPEDINIGDEEIANEHYELINSMMDENGHVDTSSLSAALVEDIFDDVDAVDFADGSMSYDAGSSHAAFGQYLADTYPGMSHDDALNQYNDDGGNGWEGHQ